jgi:HK97 family phage major capsid protein
MPFAKRLAEIKERRAAIKTEAEKADVEQLRKLNTEADELITEEAQIQERMNLAGKLGSPATEEHPAGGGAISEAEQRGRDLKQGRSITLSSDTLITAKKTGAVKDSIEGVSAIVDLVNVEDCRGMGAYQSGYEITDGDATVTTEGTAATQSDPTYGMADFVPISVTTYSEISRETLKLSGADYYARAQRSAFRALKRKLSNFIVNSDAASNAKFIGIKAATAIPSASDLSISAIDATTLRKIAMNYGGDESIVGNAVLLLNKLDLIAFGDVRGTNEKKALYEITPDAINPNTGIIKEGGLSVKYVINNGLDALSAAGTTAATVCLIYGVPFCYTLSLFSDFTIITSEHAALKTRMVAILGEVMAGGNVDVYKGFVRVKKGA